MYPQEHAGKRLTGVAISVASRFSVSVVVWNIAKWYTASWSTAIHLSVANNTRAIPLIPAASFGPVRSFTVAVGALIRASHRFS